ncbi:hypothetical protein N2152v2_007935 [Parachlorella kessleri]
MLTQRNFSLLPCTKPSVMLIESKGPQSSPGRCTRRPKVVKKGSPGSRVVAYVAQEVNKDALCTVVETSSLPKLKQTEAVVLQGFGWESHRGSNGKSWWAVLKDKVPDIQAAGFTHVWLPPPSQSVSAQGYLPGQLYNLKSRYGGKEDLIELNKALIVAGIRPVADVVINHRCADEQDENGQWTHYRDDVDHYGRHIDWGKWAITCNDPDFQGEGNPDSGEDYGAAPDLDHMNEELRNSLVDWMLWLRDVVGFQGWRFDFVRGYAAKYTAEYIERTFGDGDALCVGENFVDLRWNDGQLDYNQDHAVHVLRDWIQQAKHCMAFDFPTKGIVQEAVKHTEYDRLRGSQGKGPGLMGSWPAMAMTFVDNHDTGSTQKHWPWPSDYVLLGYAYILTHPGVPTVFYEHMYDWGHEHHDKIAQLVALRKRCGITADAKLEILAADKDLYVATINNRVMVKLGPRMDMGAHVPNDKEWKIVTWGKDFAVWERKN